MKDESNSSYGFTLVEIVVVIGIIGVLAAGLILLINPFKQFANARDAQRKSDLLLTIVDYTRSMMDHPLTPHIPAQMVMTPNNAPSAQEIVKLTKIQIKIH
jgi:prepilin-type N-terminal cleavage/methylation domain-containing protein